jgi:hypothetical protein
MFIIIVVRLACLRHVCFRPYETNSVKWHAKLLQHPFRPLSPLTQYKLLPPYPYPLMSLIPASRYTVMLLVARAVAAITVSTCMEEMRPHDQLYLRIWSKMATTISKLSALVARDTKEEPLDRITCEWVGNKAPEMFLWVGGQAKFVDRETEKSDPPWDVFSFWNKGKVAFTKTPWRCEQWAK